MIKLVTSKKLIDIYRFFFLRTVFFKFNRLVFNLSLRGLGVYNYETTKLSGEDFFLEDISKNAKEIVVFDIGANTGEYSNKIKALSPSATVYAFEPHPTTFKQLQSQALLHGYAALNLGCNDIAGSLQLYDYQEASGSQHASFYKDVIEKIHKSASTSWKVEVTTIDQFIEERNIARITLLKVDTEGNELKVLLGAKKAIENKLIDIIHFEFNEMNVVSRVFFKDFYDVLPGYVFFRMIPDGLIPLGSYNPVFCEIFAYQNVVALRDDYKTSFHNPC